MPTIIIRLRVEESDLENVTLEDIKYSLYAALQEPDDAGGQAYPYGPEGISVEIER